MREKSGTVGDVLIERAAERDVQQLVAAADGENRHVAVEGRIDQRELEAVEHRIGAVDHGCGLLAVQARVDVGAAGQQQTIERREQLDGSVVVVRLAIERAATVTGERPSRANASTYPRGNATAAASHPFTVPGQVAARDSNERTSAGHVLSSSRPMHVFAAQSAGPAPKGRPCMRRPGGRRLEC